MPEYVAGLCRMQNGELVPFDTKEFFADNHDEAVRQAVEWLSSTDRVIDGSTWLQVLFDGSVLLLEGTWTTMMSTWWQDHGRGLQAAVGALNSFKSVKRSITL